MNKQQKDVLVGTLRDKFEQTGASFFVGIQGLTVNETQKLRSQLRSKGARLQVAKVRLMKRAMHDSNHKDDLFGYLKNQIGVVFVTQDVAPVAKVLHDFSKSHNALQLVAGCVDNKIYNGSMVVKIASLPSREVLLAQLCGALKSQLVRFVLAIKHIEQTKQQSAS